MRPLRAWQPPVDRERKRWGKGPATCRQARGAGNYAGPGTWTQMAAPGGVSGPWRDRPERAAPGQPAAGSGRLGGEALAAAALGLGVRVAEHEALAQALAG